MFVATYLQGTIPTSAPLQLFFNPVGSMTCSSAVTATGVTAFTCVPLVTNGTVVVTAQGPNPANTGVTVQSSLTLQVTVKSELGLMPSSLLGLLVGFSVPVVLTQLVSLGSCGSTIRWWP